jgi:outer membrane phospholipase A
VIRLNVSLFVATIAGGCAESRPARFQPPDAGLATSAQGSSAATTSPATGPTSPPSADTAIAPDDDPPAVADPRPLESQLSGYKPTYVVAGTTPPNAKFQFSVKFRVFSPDGAAGRAVSPLSNLYFGYTQASLWDVEDPSQSTIDTTFMPELFFATHTAPRAHEQLRAAALGFQAGVQHESNGQSGEDSRNVNYVYAQPTLYFGDPDGVSGQIGPRFRAFFAESDDNPDIPVYYGHLELHGALRFGRGLQVAAIGRIGENADRGAIQIDVSYPLKQQIGGEVDVFLHVQYFNGFVESLLTYQEHHETIRVGISFVR